jgi:hypothetical protein
VGKNVRAILTCAVAVTGLVGAACSGPSLRSVEGYTPPPESPGISVDVISPTLQHQYVFERGTPAVDFQPGSKSLVEMLRSTPGLHVAALRSTPDSAAIFMIEDDQAVPWGTILLPAEKSVFEKFAADPTMGDWLMVIDDVIVGGPKDPVPVTAYRWARSDVEKYVQCGIPKPGTQNDCSKVFYLIARTVILQKSNYVPRGR